MQTLARGALAGFAATVPMTSDRAVASTVTSRLFLVHVRKAVSQISFV